MPGSKQENRYRVKSPLPNAALKVGETYPAAAFEGADMDWLLRSKAVVPEGYFDPDAVPPPGQTEIDRARAHLAHLEREQMEKAGIDPTQRRSAVTRFATPDYVSGRQEDRHSREFTGQTQSAGVSNDVLSVLLSAIEQVRDDIVNELRSINATIRGEPVQTAGQTEDKPKPDSVTV